MAPWSHATAPQFTAPSKSVPDMGPSYSEEQRWTLGRLTGLMLVPLALFGIALAARAVTALVFGDPIYVPADLDDEGIEHYRQMLEDKLFELRRQAESLVK
jgi:hypothetical protein